MMQPTYPCGNRYMRSVGLTSRSVAQFKAVGISLRPSSTSRHHAAATTYCSLSRKGNPEGVSSSLSTSSGGATSGLAKSLLRDAMAAFSPLTTSSGSKSSRAASAQRGAAATALSEDLRSATYAIAATNTVIFFICALVPLLPAATLLLSHRHPQPWQLLTSSFAHPSLEGLMQCVFFTYIFGRVVERNHGSLATWIVYALSGTAAAALAWWVLPAKSALLSSAAPAAAWGLFLVGIGLPRLTKKPLEVACLLPFTFAATVSRYSALAGLLAHEGAAQGQLVHVAGASLAAMAAAMVLGLVTGWREEKLRKEMEARRQEAAAREEEALNAMINAASQAAAQIGKKLL